MKIGEFAKVNHVSIDTIRHYMDIGLISPEKSNGQYIFDELCLEQLKDVFTLKDMGFQLNEIKTINMFKLLGNMTSYQKDAYYGMLYQKKYVNVLGEIEKLKDIKLKLKNKIDELGNQEVKQKHIIGIGLESVSIIKCLGCQSSMTISHGEIIENQLINGMLTCHCGESYEVNNGILMISDGIIEDEFQYDENYITKYISATDSRYLETIYKGIDWGKRNIDFDKLSSTTILELGSGVGFALRNMYGLLPDDCLYIAVDHDINRHIYLKKMLEQTDIKKNILFICTDFNEIPIANQSIDFVMDYSGTSNYSFEHTECLLDKIDKHIKKNAKLIGAYILFKNFESKSLIEEKYRHNFRLKNIQQKFISLGFECSNEYTSDDLNKGGLYEDFFVEGEIVFNYHYFGQRLG